MTPEMIDHFKYRLGYHLWCIHKWSNKIAALKHPLIDNDLLLDERDRHDEFKWQEPEYTPYILISWNYHCKRKNIPLELTPEQMQMMQEATFHHVKHHRHHPEFWDDEATIDVISQANRDVAGRRQVDATKMPYTYIAAMVADWCAMSEELGGHPKAWADKSVGTRWKFTEAQRTLIYGLIEWVWDVR